MFSQTVLRRSKFSIEPPSSNTERTLMHLLLFIKSPKENWFQYVHKVYKTAIDFPCLTFIGSTYIFLTLIIYFKFKILQCSLNTYLISDEIILTFLYFLFLILLFFSYLLIKFWLILKKKMLDILVGRQSKRKNYFKRVFLFF